MYNTNDIWITKVKDAANLVNGNNSLLHLNKEKIFIEKVLSRKIRVLTQQESDNYEQVIHKVHLKYEQIVEGIAKSIPSSINSFVNDSLLTNQIDSNFIRAFATEDHIVDSYNKFVTNYLIEKSTTLFHSLFTSKVPIYRLLKVSDYSQAKQLSEDFSKFLGFSNNYIRDYIYDISNFNNSNNWSKEKYDGLNSSDIVDLINLQYLHYIFI